MEVVSASRLLELIEQLSAPSGAGLRSPEGPGGAPDPELVRAFEVALENGTAEGGDRPIRAGDMGLYQQQEGLQQANELASQSPQSQDAVKAVGFDARFESVEDLGSTRQLRPVEGDENRPRRTEAASQELERLNTRIHEGEISPAELYRVQYLMGMLQVQLGGGIKVSQQIGQGIESVLKQQG